jgi:hypothetical protein
MIAVGDKITSHTVTDGTLLPPLYAGSVSAFLRNTFLHSAQRNEREPKNATPEINRRISLPDE